MVTIVAYGCSNKYSGRNSELLKASQQPYYLLASVQVWLTLVLDLIVAGMASLLVGLAIGLKDSVDAGYLGLALLGVMDLGANFSGLILSWTLMETSLGAVQRIREFVSQTPEEGQGQLDPAPEWPSRGDINFRNLSAGYSLTSESVLKDLELTVPSGQKLAICGRTGSGKSSLISTLFGLLHIKSGSITIDGISTSEVNQDLLRSKVISIPQDPYFLPGSVREKLSMTADPEQAPSADTALTVLEKVGLRCKLEEEATRRNADGTYRSPNSLLDMELQPADTLTKGQQQLFALARAMLTLGRVLVMDEATSGLDQETEEAFVRLVEQHFKEHTVIAIAHYLATIMDFDRVLVMDGGSIAEDGRPSKLAGTEGSLFRALLDASR